MGCYHEYALSGYLENEAESVARAAAESGTKARPGCIDMMHNVVIENLRFPKSFSQSDLPELSIRQRDSDKRTSVKTHLLVGADGFNSSVRKASGIHTIGWKHDQSAIVANLNLGPEYDYTTAWQRFLETGPIAFLPFGPQRCSVTWSTTNSEAKRLMALTDEEFVNELNRCMLQPCHRPSGIVSGLTKALRMAISRKNESFMPPTILSVQPGTRTKFPLSFSHCTFYHGPRVALIGDAAHRILPLSGQGVNMGLGDASCLAHTIDRALFEGCDIADPRHLARFTSERQRSVAPMGFFIEGIQALYTPDEVFGGPLTMHGPVTSSRALIRRLSAKCGVSDALLSIRGLGLDFVDACSPVKNFFVEGAVKGRIQFPLFR
uniref:Ubiquinone biosynthesis monooxygenase COQ6, mitochondrial n=1 Tax=Mesocestoides corti TaxID=53468 RepID=A0A5K3F4J9_MESCO